MEDITRDIIGAAIEVHKHFGPGLLEKIYERALEVELKQRGFKVSHQTNVPIVYKGVTISDEDTDLHLDLFVNDTVIVELKSVVALEPINFKQLHSYLKLLQKPVGLIFNFNVINLMRDGFGRVILNEYNK